MKHMKGCAVPQGKNAVMKSYMNATILADMAYTTLITYLSSQTTAVWIISPAATTPVVTQAQSAAAKSAALMIGSAAMTNVALLESTAY